MSQYLNIHVKLVMVFSATNYLRIIQILLVWFILARFPLARFPLARFPIARFPIARFPQARFCSAISPSLIHAKRWIRQSAFECMATIHQVEQITCIYQIQGSLIRAVSTSVILFRYFHKLTPCQTSAFECMATVHQVG